MQIQFKAEWRQRYALHGILLHVAATVFVVQLSVRITEPPLWNAVFWILTLFSAVSAAGRSFIQEPKGRMLYYYGVASPQNIILARMAYNWLLMVVLVLANLLLYCLFIGSLIQHIPTYLMVLLLASGGYAGVLTFVSAIASKAGNSHLLMPVLSFPVVLPILLVAIKASKKAVDGLETFSIYQDLGALLLLNLAVAGMAYVLFPYLWKE
ncbi:MAG: ABC transporter permease [Flavobacteriaceae bacterium]|nr:ABC transporter permease [Flavobacteriaceae bacterium]